MGDKWVVGYTCAGAGAHPTEQEKRIRSWASDHGHSTLWVGGDLGDVSPDPAVRPGLLRLFHAIETLGGEKDILVVFYDLGLAFPVTEARTVVLCALQAYGLFDLAARGAVDTAADPQVRQLFAAVSSLHRLRQAVRLRVAKTRTSQARRAHERVGEIPLGFCLADISGKLAPYEPEREAARRARELQRAGQSLRQIGRTLLIEGYPPRGKSWGHATVSRLLALSETLH